MTPSEITYLIVLLLMIGLVAWSQIARVRRWRKREQREQQDQQKAARPRDDLRWEAEQRASRDGRRG